MSRDFSVGCKVVLTESMQRICTEPEKYKSGVVTRIGSWGVVDVQWNGIDRPIGMRADEIVEARDGE